MELKEAKELLVWAGTLSGFDVMFEFPVIFWDEFNHGRIDCAWFTPGKHVPKVVFEIEGINVQKPSLQNDLKKFRWSKASHKVVILYSERRGGMLVKDNEVAERKVQQRISEIQRAQRGRQRVEVISVVRAGCVERMVAVACKKWGGAI